MLLQVYLTTGLFVIVSWISFIVPPEVVPGTNKTFLVPTLALEEAMSDLCMSIRLSVYFMQSSTQNGSNRVSAAVAF